MAYLLKKRGKYLAGHSYATGLGYSFRWTANAAEAARFSDDSPYAERFAGRTGAKVERVPNTRKESKALAKRGAL